MGSNEGCEGRVFEGVVLDNGDDGWERDSVV